MEDPRWNHVLAAIKLCNLLFAATLVLPVTAANKSESADTTADGLAQQQGSNQFVDVQQMDIEEIKIIGQNLIVDLQHQIYRAEDVAYELFNDLNDDNQYDIHCLIETRTGTTIKKRMCRPNFFHTATRANFQDFLGSLGGCDTSGKGSCASPMLYAGPAPSLRNELNYRFPILKKKVKELALKNPELNKAMQDLFTLTQQLHTTREIYHGDDMENK